MAKAKAKAKGKVKVELLVSRAGGDFAQNIGDVLELSAADAKRLIEAGQAKPLSKSAREKAEKL